MCTQFEISIVINILNMAIIYNTNVLQQPCNFE